MNRTDLLRESRLFRDCTEPELARLADMAVDHEFEDGHALFTLGEQARDVMVIASGEVQLEFPLRIFDAIRSIAFETKGRSEVVGWSALAPPYLFTLSGRVKGGVSLLAIAQSDLTALFESEPSLGLRVMKNVAAIASQRLQHTQVLWADEVQRTLNERYR
jgi:CRP-like cAMP-binding protein